MSARRNTAKAALGLCAMLLSGCGNPTPVASEAEPGTGEAAPGESFCTLIGEQETADQLEARLRQKCKPGDLITNLGYWYAVSRDPSSDQSLQFQLKRAPALIARFCDMTKQVVIPNGDNFVCYLAEKRNVY